MHISFVRSISMDAFKAAEIERMRLGGNERWREFFEKHADTELRGISWDDATIAERYGGEAGDEYKERLSALVDGRDYVPGEKKKAAPAENTNRSTAPLGGSADGSKNGGGGGRFRDDPSLGGSRSESPSGGATSGGKTRVDDKYFARLGADNASRSEDLPPSQGGKYAGFGNTPAPAPGGAGGNTALPSMDELQNNPVAALSKGFGWFASTVTKTATTVNNNYIQPTAKQVCGIYVSVSFDTIISFSTSGILTFTAPKSRSQIRTLQHRLAILQVRLGERRSREPRAHKPASTDLSRGRTAGNISKCGKPRSTRPARGSGMTFPTSLNNSRSSSRSQAPLAPRPWARVEAAVQEDPEVLRLAKRPKRMNGMIGSRTKNALGKMLGWVV